LSSLSELRTPRYEGGSLQEVTSTSSAKSNLSSDFEFVDKNDKKKNVGKFV